MCAWTERWDVGEYLINSMKVKLLAHVKRSPQSYINNDPNESTCSWYVEEGGWDEVVTHRARLHAGIEVGLGCDASEGVAAADALGEEHDVRDQVLKVLVPPPFTSAPHACLHLHAQRPTQHTQQMSTMP